MADKIKECTASGIRAAHELRMAYLHEVEPGTTLEDVTTPGYWKNVWRELNRSRYAIIECIAKDQSWEATLRVYAVGDGFAKVRVIGGPWEAAKKAGRPAKLPDGWEAAFVDHGWRVRNADGEIVVEKQPTEHEAIAMANQLHKKIAA